ncbi:MAG: 4-hydroxy-tetrahydrodipicolinate reductase [Prevotella sp.]|nr:4-hydroxy-tetrahydrodipicolinate reductase [Prevotella sp.]MCM1075590.1 4-hydroxy-tetrahydrodipicolinate reductase [Ruminococcus sp.]
MKIAIVGYGRMGHEVEAMARARGHEVVCTVDINNTEAFESEAFKSADMAINFSTPDSGWDNISRCWAAGLPVVSGTTGWADEIIWDEVHRECDKGATLLWAPNFSIGMNITHAASQLLAKMFTPFPEYQVRIHEVHHIHKKDHPSGSAILLANSIVENSSRYNVWVEPGERKLTEGAVPVTSERRGEVPGIHEVTWESDVDTITLKHEAKNRHGFALGAVVAAEWLIKAPKGHLYNMTDVLNSMIKNEL